MKFLIRGWPLYIREGGYDISLKVKIHSSLIKDVSIPGRTFSRSDITIIQ